MTTWEKEEIQVTEKEKVKEWRQWRGKRNIKENTFQWNHQMSFSWWILQRNYGILLIVKHHSSQCPLFSEKPSLALPLAPSYVHHLSTHSPFLLLLFPFLYPTTLLTLPFHPSAHHSPQWASSAPSWCPDQPEKHTPLVHAMAYSGMGGSLYL